jgi:putative endopeptidase
MAKCDIGYVSFEKDFKETKEAAAAEKDIVSKYKQIKVKDIAPYDNFYNYINYSWLQNIKVDEQQKYIVQVDDFRLAQDRVYRNLHDIILEYTKSNHSPFAKHMKNMYDSIIRMNNKSDSRKRGFEILSTIDQLRSSPTNLYKMLAFLNKSEITSSRCPLPFVLYADDKNPSKFISIVDTYAYNILDNNVYVDDGKDEKYRKDYKRRFIENTNDIFDTVLGKGKHDLKGEDVFKVEQLLYNVWDYNEITEPVDGYNKLNAREALNKLDFDWVSFAKEYGFVHAPEHFTAPSLNYIKATMKLLNENWTSKEWRSFWAFGFMKMLVRITSDWEELLFDFYGKFERGQEKINMSSAVSSALYMSLPYNTFLTNNFVKKYGDPRKKLFVERLCDDLRHVFHRIVSKNTWLNPKTRKYALKKLEHITFLVGQPNKLLPDPNLAYGDNLYDNLSLLMDARRRLFISLVGKDYVDLPVMDWNSYPVKMVGSQAYIVNASYTPSKNSVYINWGYIQKPFVDLEERGIEYNLAHIGYTIAHELGHSLDDLGSQYDHTGVLKNWWTPQDKKKFEQLQKDVIFQYEEFARRDGIKFDASIGIGEDLADIAGMAICDTFLRDFQQKNNDLIPIRNTSFDAYYTYFAFQQKQKISKAAIQAQLKTNPHPLDVYRTNIPLSRSTTFRKIYDVKKGDGMWWHDTNTIW